MNCKFDISLEFLILLSARLSCKFFLCSIYFLVTPNCAGLMSTLVRKQSVQGRCDVYLYFSIKCPKLGDFYQILLLSFSDPQSLVWLCLVFLFSKIKKFQEEYKKTTVKHLSYRISS